MLEHASRMTLSYPKRCNFTRLFFFFPPSSEDSVSAFCPLNSHSLSRLPYFLGGVQPDQHQGDALPAECHLGVQGDRAHRSHHVHHRGGGHDLKRPGPAVLLHHFLRRPTRSVTSYLSVFTRCKDVDPQ